MHGVASIWLIDGALHFVITPNLWNDPDAWMIRQACAYTLNIIQEDNNEGCGFNRRGGTASKVWKYR